MNIFMKALHFIITLRLSPPALKHLSTYWFSYLTKLYVFDFLQEFCNKTDSLYMVRTKAPAEHRDLYVAD